MNLHLNLALIFFISAEIYSPNPNPVEYSDTFLFIRKYRLNKCSLNLGVIQGLYDLQKAKTLQVPQLLYHIFVRLSQDYRFCISNIPTFFNDFFVAFVIR